MEPKNITPLEPNSKTVSLRMSDNNGESHYQGHVLIANMRKRLKALRPGNRSASTSAVGGNSTGADLTNLLLIKLLEK